MNPIGANDVRDFQPEGVRRNTLRNESDLLCQLSGSFTVLAEDPHTVVDDAWGGLVAIATYVRRRGFGNVPLGSDQDKGPLG
ncbi:MAG: hypothetical protein AAGC97_20520, partial [Planctomycetota bacterium]